MCMTQLIFKQPLDDSEDKELKKEYVREFRTRLKEIRKSKNITQQSLAEKSGLDLSYIGNLELGRYAPSIYIVWKISKILGVPTSELVDF